MPDYMQDTTEKFRLPEISFDEICYLMLYIQGELLADEEKMDVILVSKHVKQHHQYPEA